MHSEVKKQRILRVVSGHAAFEATRRAWALLPGAVCSLGSVTIAVEAVEANAASCHSQFREEKFYSKGGIARFHLLFAREDECRPG